MNQRDIILFKARSILYQLPYGLDMARDWSRDNFEKYYLYFNDSSKELRVSSIVVFYAALENWTMKSAFPFTKKRNQKKWENHTYFDLDDYLRQFLLHADAIQQELPATYELILQRLEFLINEGDVENHLDIENIPLVEEVTERLSKLGERRKYLFPKLVEEVGNLYLDEKNQTIEW